MIDVDLSVPAFRAQSVVLCPRSPEHLRSKSRSLLGQHLTRRMGIARRILRGNRSSSNENN